jgi:2-polyprenyl-3-methyl-5-hydroxy-6-metoxy-1,4-benzoquinol methylase
MSGGLEAGRRAADPSAAETAPDVETSSAAYARRFQGSVGSWFLEVQARLTLELLRPWPGARVLDVGGGHGQLTGPLIEAGYEVTVLSSDASCRARVGPWIDGGRARFEVGDLRHPPFSARSFDAALSFRLLPHLADWPALVAGLCRMARRAVILDYPTRRSVNTWAGALFEAKQRLEGDTRPFRVFDDREVEEAFAAHGFQATARRPQFLLPMALHRGLHLAVLSRGLEAAARGLGLTRRWGSPVVLRAEPRG